MNKKIIKIVSSLLIILTIFTFSVVLASDDTVYVWSSEAEPLSTQTSATTQSNTIQTNSNMLKNEITFPLKTILHQQLTIQVQKIHLLPIAIKTQIV